MSELPQFATLDQYYRTAYTGSIFWGGRNQALAEEYFELIREDLSTLLSGPIMEVGGAEGHLSKMVAASSGRRVIMVDPARSSATWDGVEARRGFLSEKTLEPQCAFVFGGHVLEHVRNPKEWISLCAKALRPGGRLVLLTPNASSWKFALFRMGWTWSGFTEHVHLFSHQAALRLLSVEGFEVNEIIARSPGLTHRPRVSLCLNRWLKFKFSKGSFISKPRAAPARNALLLKWLRPLDEVLEIAGDAIFGRERRDELWIKATYRPERRGHVVAVVVTHNRLIELKRCLAALESQTRRPNSIVVIDNASSDGTAAWLASQSGLVVIRQENLGSGGGQNRGIEEAQSLGAEWIWTMDDDGEAAADCLERLLAEAEATGLSMASAAVVNRDNHAELSFRIRNRYDRAVLNELAQDGVAHGELSPFNGTLIRSALVRRIGNVNTDLFIWGDEREYFLRARDAGEPMGIVISAVFYHPRARMPFYPILGGKYEVAYPATKMRVAYHFRNIGYQCRQYSPWRETLRFLIKYGLFYIEAPRERMGKIRMAYFFFLKGRFRGVQPLAEFQASVKR